MAGKYDQFLDEDVEPVEVERNPTGSSVLSIRLPSEDFYRLCRVAEQMGLSRGEFAREIIQDAMARRVWSRDLLRETRVTVHSSIAAKDRTASTPWGKHSGRRTSTHQARMKIQNLDRYVSRTAR